MREYLRQSGISRHFERNVSVDELLNGRRGPEPWSPADHPTEPDYSEVSGELFDYFESPDILVLERKLEVSFGETDK